MKGERREELVTRTVVAVTFLSILLLNQPLYGADCEKAKAYFQQAIKLPEDQPRLLRKELLYKRAIELCPSYAEAHNNLGDTYEKQGMFEEAIAQYKKAVQLKPSFAIAHFGLGDVYVKTNRHDEAIKSYQEGLKYDDKDALTRVRLAKAGAIVEDMRKSGVIKADTIRGMLSTTRGPGDVVSITFGEGLIPFDFDKYNIRPDARPQLNEIGKALKDILGARRDISVIPLAAPLIEIAGHADIRGTDRYNLNLTRRRAESVVEYVVTNFSIPRERLMPKGYGKRVTLCTTDSSEACHALNRRVELVKHPGGRPAGARSVSFRERGSEEIKMDLGFFYQREGEKLVKILEEDSRLRSRSDRYFLFFRPLQDSYVYVIQEDSKSKIALIFPQKGNKRQVVKGTDYWVPSFGKAFTLDETKGEEKLYLIATSWPLESAIDDLSLQEQVRGAIRSLTTRTIKVVRPSNAPQPVSAAELNKKPQRIESLLERVEGEGGWVKVLKFLHE